MSSEEKKQPGVDLHTEFICGNSEQKEFEEGRSFWHQEYIDKQVARSIVTEIGDAGGLFGKKGKTILSNNIKFAKFFYLRLIGNYFAGDFTFETKNDRFAHAFGEVWPEIISKGFYGTVYIGMDEWLIKAERKVIEENGNSWWSEKNFPMSKIRLYVMEREEYETKNKSKYVEGESVKLPTFRSVWTNVGGLKINPERLVRFSLNGISNFIFLWDLLDKYLYDLQLYDRYFALATKRISVCVEDEKKAQKEADFLLNKNMPFMMFNNATPQGGQSDNEWDEFPAPDLEGLAIIMHALQARMDERMRFIGAYGKALGQTKERKQVGETWLDHKWVNNVREVHKMKIESMIKALKIFFPKKVPYDLRIKVTSQEPHMDERFKDMHNWKGGDDYQGDHFNKSKPIKGEGKF